MTLDKRVVGTLLTAVACALLMVATASAGDLTVLAKASHTGPGAAAIVIAPKVERRTPVYLRIRTRPAQRVLVEWSATCVEGSDAVTKRRKFTAMAPVLRRLTLPLRAADDCGLSVTAQLWVNDRGVVGSGRIAAAVLGSR